MSVAPGCSPGPQTCVPEAQRGLGRRLARGEPTDPLVSTMRWTPGCSPGSIALCGEAERGPEARQSRAEPAPSTPDRGSAPAARAEPAPDWSARGGRTRFRGRRSRSHGGRRRARRQPLRLSLQRASLEHIQNEWRVWICVRSWKYWRMRRSTTPASPRPDRARETRSAARALGPRRAWAGGTAKLARAAVGGSPTDRARSWTASWILRPGAGPSRFAWPSRGPGRGR